ncbi:MAG: hypothetical protein ACOX18_02255 [Bacillota bacterium]|jgi:hypothetical protein
MEQLVTSNSIWIRGGKHEVLARLAWLSKQFGDCPLAELIRMLQH